MKYLVLLPSKTVGQNRRFLILPATKLSLVGVPAKDVEVYPLGDKPLALEDKIALGMKP